MKHIELLHHILQYSKTGIIDDELLPCFDQEGCWRGSGNCRLDIAHHAAIRKISKAVLPVSRRTKKSRSGTILRTSFIWRGVRPITLKYCEIKGSLVVFENASLRAANLRHIGGRFCANNSNQIDLPILTSVGGSFEAVHGYCLKAPRLREVGGGMVIVYHIPPRIETVGGRFGAYWVFDLSPLRLRHVGGALVAPKAEVVVAPVLETIRGGFLLNNMTRRVHAPCLQSVGGDFLADAVIDLCVPRLRGVGGDLNTRSAQGFYHPEIRVAGEWTICPGAQEEWTRRERARQALRGDGVPIWL